MEPMTQTAPQVLDNKQLQKRWSSSVDYLDDNFAYFLTHVLHIGRPYWTEAIPTAAVSMSQRETPVVKNKIEDYDFDFLFSPKFASKLPVNAMAFILAHETMHIVLNHLKLVEQFLDRGEAKDLIEKKRNGTRLTKDEIKKLIVAQQNAQRFNIAADCVINDYLVNSGMDDSAFYNFPGSPMYNPEAPEGAAMLCRGIDKIGESAAFLTVHDVYERLEEEQKNKKNKKKGDGQGGSGQGTPGGQGEPGEEDDMDGRGGQAIDSHDWLLDPDYADELADAIDKLNDEIEKAGKMPSDLIDKKDEEDGKDSAASQQLQKSMQAGSEAGNISEFMGATGAKLGWVRLLKELDPDMFKEPAIAPPPVAQWHKRPRKLGGMPKVILPVREKGVREKHTHEKPAIVLALDVSGSIGPRDADRFIELAKSIPDERIKLFTCTFDTSYQKVDIQNDTNFRIGGGTHFDSIPNFINDHVKPELKGKYPKAVVVITDGMAPLSKNLWPTEEEAQGWYWLISPQDGASSYYPASKQIGRRDKLETYVV
jgi:hypothetical protein